MKANYSKYKMVALASVVLFASPSCKKFIEVDLTSNRISTEDVYTNDVIATSAVIGIYSSMLNDESFGSGSSRSVVSLAGLSADELVNYPQNSLFVQFQENDLDPSNDYINGLWTSMYKIIYMSNAVIEGMEASPAITESLKSQLQGEAYFFRAFAHFYLVNLFGDAPLVNNTDYKVNAVINRSPVEDVYNQIIADLTTAQELLRADYPKVDAFTDGERVRVNKFTATALLARVYLFRGDWTNAELQATSVINESDRYRLEDSLDNVFLRTSLEAIWQLQPKTPTVLNTLEGFNFIPNGQIENYINPDLLAAIEPLDLRREKWLAYLEDGADTIYYPFKYKVQQSSDITEYSMVFRLAEQYLIRSEARAQLNNIAGAQDDINVIRKRSLLNNTTAADQASLLSMIEQERRVEFLCEWGHRWFDLKRWDRASAVLAPQKNDWTNDDALYPLPQLEMNKNPHLAPQNPNY